MSGGSLAQQPRERGPHAIGDRSIRTVSRRPTPLAFQRPGAIVLATITVLASACRAPADPAPHPTSWNAALASVRTGLAERHASWGPLPPAGSARRTHLGQLAEYARATLRPIRDRPEATTAEELARFLPAATDGSAASAAVVGRFTYLGHGYAKASARISLASGTAWLEIVDCAGAADLVVPFEVKRAVAANDTAGQYRATTIAGFPAVESELAHTDAPGLVARLVEVAIGDRALVIARGDRDVSSATLRALIEGVDLAAIHATFATKSAREGHDASPPQPSEDG